MVPFEDVDVGISIQQQAYDMRMAHIRCGEQRCPALGITPVDVTSLTKSVFNLILVSQTGSIVQFFVKTLSLVRASHDTG